MSYKTKYLNLFKYFKFISFYFHPKYHKNLGAILPSSPFLAKNITSLVDINKNSKKILEIGAGTGIFTKYIVKKLNKNDLLDIVEINKSFATSLDKKYKNNNNVKVYNQSILDFSSDLKYDYIISGLPFNYFNPEIVKKIFTKYKNITTDDGIISYFEYAFISSIKTLIIKKQKTKRIVKYFRRQFIVKKRTSYLNIPPAIVWHLKKY